MKTYKVYSLINSNCKEQYIGVTSQTLTKRFKEHTYTFNTNSKSYSKMRDIAVDIKDFKIVLVKEFTNRKEAYKYEKTMIQFVNKTLGVFNKQTVDAFSTEHRHNLHLANLKQVHDRVECPHCNLQGAKPIMNRWHFNNCKAI